MFTLALKVAFRIFQILMSWCHVISVKTVSLVAETHVVVYISVSIPRILTH